jgi:hypothetical protein
MHLAGSLAELPHRSARLLAEAYQQLFERYLLAWFHPALGTAHVNHTGRIIGTHLVESGLKLASITYFTISH